MEETVPAGIVSLDVVKPLEMSKLDDLEIVFFDTPAQGQTNDVMKQENDSADGSSPQYSSDMYLSYAIEDCAVKEEYPEGYGSDFEDHGIEMDEQEIAGHSDYDENEEEMFISEAEVKPDTLDLTSPEAMIDIIKGEFGQHETSATDPLEKVQSKDEKQLMKIIGTVNSRKCYICGKLFENKVEKDAHTEKEHNSKGIKYHCAFLECDRKFTDKTLLSGHINEQHLGSCYSCSICHIKSKTIPTLSKHIRTSHPGQKGRPMDYEFSARSIVSLDHLADDDELRAAEMEDVPLSQRRVKHKSNKSAATVSRKRIKKILKYALVRRYCHICKEFFKTIQEFKRHFESTHGIPTPKRKYMCPQFGCTDAYTVKDSLVVHMQKVHFGFYYRCSVCRKRINIRGVIGIHYKRYHPEHKEILFREYRRLSNCKK
jgi:hypothetical protein